jgi:hypothetical protein
MLRRDDGRREHVLEFLELHVRARPVRLRPEHLHLDLRSATPERQDDRHTGLHVTGARVVNKPGSGYAGP